MGYNTTKLSDEDLQEIFRLHKSGVSMRQLGKQFGVSHRSIGWRLSKNSVDNRLKGGASSATALL